jgi:hypothetical protein
MITVRRLLPQALTIMLLGIVLFATSSKQMFSTEESSSVSAAAHEITTDWLLEKSASDPDGHQLVAGSWQFPGFGWKISTTTTSSSPTVPTTQFVNAEGGTQPGSQSFDEQLMALIRSLMISVENRGPHIVYEKRSASLRGVALCLRAGELEIPEFVSLQWPASESLWTELTLQRDSSSESLTPIMPLPFGSRIYAQRVGVDQKVHYQAADIPVSRSELLNFLSDHGFEVHQLPEDQRTLRVDNGRQSFDLTTKEPGLNQISVLLRQVH